MSKVEALIEQVMAKHKGIGPKATAAYYEAVHQELAPLARELERALEPFAKHPEFHAPDEWAVTIIDQANRTPGVTAGDFRRAKAVLTPNAEVTGA